MSDKVLSYFGQDLIAADTWKDKYCMKNKEGEPQEGLPSDMHMRMAREFARIEFGYIATETSRQKNSVDNLKGLSAFGEQLFFKRVVQTEADIIHEIFDYFDKFQQIVPQGSLMSNLGNYFVFGSLSNCFGIESPLDSYGGIMKTDQELVQLMKRRGGVGTSLDNLRPAYAYVSNAAKSSSGVISWAERFSNSTREVAQEGRRGAFMILLHVRHPQIFDFVKMKEDRTKVTGANVSVKFTDDFMKAVEADADFYCTFPVDTKLDPNDAAQYHYEYNKLIKINITGQSSPTYIMRIHAKELFEEFVTMAHSNAEPGAAFLDTIVNYSPDGVYDIFCPKVCNPCGEQWFSDDETCRLIVKNFFGFIDSAFTDRATCNFERLYEVAYIQQRLGDDLVDLEVECIDRILKKLETDPEPMEIKSVEINLWARIRAKAIAGRRTGNGFTALGDMLAAMGLGYNDSSETMTFIEKVMKTKMEAELDATIDMGILRGTFEGWDALKEFAISSEGTLDYGFNSFYEMLLKEFPEQAYRMAKYGRRNVSWSTVSPTGTVSLMTQTTSGLEPLFAPFYMRKKKIVPSQKDVRVDFVDETGDSWQEYPVLHPKFRDWIGINGYKYTEHEVTPDVDTLSKEGLTYLFEKSPWFGSTANDIPWQTRIKINTVIQKYISNSLSCTINLPKDISKEVVHNIYMEAWRAGLKGITVYRDGSRDGVLNVETAKLTNCDEFGYTDAIKRPKELEADYHYITSKGKNYAVFVGKLNDNPYELFAFEDPIRHDDVVGKIVKVESGVYKFDSPHYIVENLQLNSDHIDEKLLTRWISMLLRHGANPKFIIDQVDKSEVSVVSFAKAITRVLKTYIENAQTDSDCPKCKEGKLVYQEGCKSCKKCGYSAC